MTFAPVCEKKVYPLREFSVVIESFPFLPIYSRRGFGYHLNPDLWYRKYEIENLTLVLMKVFFLKEYSMS